MRLSKVILGSLNPAQERRDGIYSPIKMSTSVYTGTYKVKNAKRMQCVEV